MLSSRRPTRTRDGTPSSRANTRRSSRADSVKSNQAIMEARAKLNNGSSSISIDGSTNHQRARSDNVSAGFNGLPPVAENTQSFTSSFRAEAGEANKPLCEVARPKITLAAVPPLRGSPIISEEHVVQMLNWKNLHQRLQNPLQSASLENPTAGISLGSLSMEAYRMPLASDDKTDLLAPHISSAFSSMSFGSGFLQSASEAPVQDTSAQMDTTFITNVGGTVRELSTDMEDSGKKGFASLAGDSLRSSAAEKMFPTQQSRPSSVIASSLTSNSPQATALRWNGARNGPLLTSGRNFVEGTAAAMRRGRATTHAGFTEARRRGMINSCKLSIEKDGLLPTFDEIARRLADSGFEQGEVDGCVRICVSDPEEFGIVSGRDASKQLRSPLSIHTTSEHACLAEVASLRQTLFQFHESRRIRLQGGRGQSMSSPTFLGARSDAQSLH